MSEKKLLARIRKDGRKIAKRFKLRYLSISTESSRVRSRFGSCDEDKVIRIRLYNLSDGRFLKYPGLIHTLCHELAHLRFMDHRNNFKQLHQRLLEWARNRGIYRPAY